MNSRRKFIRGAAMAASFVGVPMGKLLAKRPKKETKPIVVSTWNFGVEANEAAWTVLEKSGRALDAVVKGVMVPESDPTESSVGYGGRPDRDGRVTLDSCIMDELGNCGSVACLEHIKNPVLIARAVMEKTPHVMLVGDGALQFALSEGFKKEDLLTKDSKKAWEKWKETNNYEPVINVENHDTIGMLAMDINGDISGACTTSGLAYKMHGRVGDSPIIGAGLFVDNEVGGATATGMGEEVIKIVGSHLVVELMRQGKSPQEACKVAVERIVKKNKNYKDVQIGFLALNKNGETGAYCIHKGFTYAVKTIKSSDLIDGKHYVP
ncbi:N(4)-(beta-N-acetylglucosaminyl)-L-asparaginase [Flammeovirgaceae bacterium SG7u.111]|nr:N(4)-(beta-N-acetylglucosaminyl)-L-asparaginase [Flammeovirgaceae bacterium SG7u.132]WPO34402.1 N(4)-(beta-N-acetylglucosaminyl)-L-asparaginase [Flammeovirgaceae bacterium SG7u.111]